MYLNSIPQSRGQLSDHDDALSWKFLRGDYADYSYSGWSLDERLTAFLRREGLNRIADDGDRYAALLDRVMAHIPAACSVTRSSVLDRTARAAPVRTATT